MVRIVVILPTYDEKDNVRPMTDAILSVCPQADILFVDDNSPDGTGRIIDEIAAENGSVKVIHRTAQRGLGRAYVAGFKWALEREYDFIIQMDCDFSHNPKEIPHLLAAAEHADLALGSRYVGGIRIINWPLRRLMLSRGAAMYVRLVTGLPVSDPTGGYKCFRRRVLEAMDLNRITSNGYSFLFETTHTAWIMGFRIVEVPIIFEDRQSGYSKMSMKIFREALLMAWRLAIRNGFRRSPRRLPAEMAPTSAAVQNDG